MAEIIPFNKKKREKAKREKNVTNPSDRKIVRIDEKVKVDLNMATNDWGMQINMDTVYGMMVVPEVPGIGVWFNDFMENAQGIPTVAYDILIPYQSKEAAEADMDQLYEIVMSYRGEQ